MVSGFLARPCYVFMISFCGNLFFIVVFLFEHASGVAGRSLVEWDLLKPRKLPNLSEESQCLLEGCLGHSEDSPGILDSRGLSMPPMASTKMAFQASRLPESPEGPEGTNERIE